MGGAAGLRRSVRLLGRERLQGADLARQVDDGGDRSADGLAVALRVARVASPADGVGDPTRQGGPLPVGQAGGEGVEQLVQHAVTLRLQQPVALLEVGDEDLARPGQPVGPAAQPRGGVLHLSDGAGQLVAHQLELRPHLPAHLGHDALRHRLGAFDHLEGAGRPLGPEAGDHLGVRAGRGPHLGELGGGALGHARAASDRLIQSDEALDDVGLQLVDGRVQDGEPLPQGAHSAPGRAQQLGLQVAARCRDVVAQLLEQACDLCTVGLGRPRQGDDGLTGLGRRDGAGGDCGGQLVDPGAQPVAQLTRLAGHRGLQLGDPRRHGDLDLLGGAGDRGVYDVQALTDLLLERGQALLHEATAVLRGRGERAHLVGGGGDDAVADLLHRGQDVTSQHGHRGLELPADGLNRALDPGPHARQRRCRGVVTRRQLAPEPRDRCQHLPVHVVQPGAARRVVLGGPLPGGVGCCEQVPAQLGVDQPE